MEVTERVFKWRFGLALCVLWLAATAGLALAQVEPTDETIAVAAEAGVDPGQLQGAVNSTGFSPRDYLYATGELSAPIAAPAPSSSSGGPYGLTGYLLGVARCESRLNPGAVGRMGEIGLFQLAPFGLLPTFYRMGFTNPWDGWQQAAFARWAFGHGLARAWSCA